MARMVSDDLEELIQKSLAPIQSEKFTLSIYFGHNLARRHDPLARELFNQFRAPMLRADFTRNGKWHLRNVQAMPTSEVPDSHWPFVMDVATEYFAGRRARMPKRNHTRYDPGHPAKHRGGRAALERKGTQALRQGGRVAGAFPWN